MRTLQAVLIASVLASGCNKEDEPTGPMPPPQPSYSVGDFSLLEPGNYWVYQRISLDTAGNIANVSDDYDSLFISGTAAVNGYTYAVLSKALNGLVNPNLQELRRDSADCIVDGSGRIIFRYGVFDQLAWTYVDPMIFQYDWYLSSATSAISVAAGTFDAHAMNCELTQVGGLVPPPTDRDAVYWWTPGVGKVREDLYYYSSGTALRRDLVRYNVQ